MKPVLSLFKRARASILSVVLLTLIGNSAPAIAAEIDDLIKAAKAEGEVTLYSAATENIIKKLAEAFTATYGIKVSALRMSSTILQQRYLTEAQSGNIAADVMLNAGNTDTFTAEGIAKGWMGKVSDARLPVMTSGQFPKAFDRGTYAIVQIAPWGMAYNTDTLKGDAIPKSWNDLIDPKRKGRVIIPDPAVSDANLDIWALLLDKYGEAYFTALRANEPRYASGGVPGIQSLAAGEGDIQAPVVSLQVASLQEKGAPIKYMLQDLSTGVEMGLVMTHPAKSKHPNAARLLANFAMSKEGGAAFSDGVGSLSVYDTSQLPKQYEAPKPGTPARKEEIRKLLGFK